MIGAPSTLPQVSVVTPSLNSERFIEDTILCIQGQRYPSVEHILMDGGSRDRTLEIVERYRARFARVESGPDGGMYEAIQRGFEQTGGEIMTWLNTDDVWLPGTLRTIGGLFRDFPDVEWLTTRYAIAIDETGAMLATNRFSGFSDLGFRRGEFLSRAGWPAYGFIQQESTFWRRSLWERAGGHLDTSLKLAGDFELWSRFFKHAALWCVDVPLGCFRHCEGQKTATAMPRYLEEAGAVFRRDGGRLPHPALARLRLNLRRVMPGRLRTISDRLGLIDRRPFLRWRQGLGWTQDWL